MKIKDSIDSLTVKRSMRTGILLVIVAAVTLEATSLIQNYFAQKNLREEASMRAESRLDILESEIMDVINQAEAGVRNKVWIAQWCLNIPDSLPRVAQLVVKDNPVLVGSTVALVPGYDRDRPLYAPYAARTGEKGDSLAFLSLATESYDYPSKEWFTKPLEIDEGYWSEPYIDVGGGEIPMTTYSVPIRDTDGRNAGVLTGDISLDWLTDLVGDQKIYPNSRTIMLSRKGLFMVSPREEVVMTMTVQEVVSQLADSMSFKAINRAMLNGETGESTVTINGDKHHVYYAPVERTGWSMCIIIPNDDVYSGIRKDDMLILLFQLLGLAMLLIILRSFIKGQMKYSELNERKERMEGELQIASRIQMSMVPDSLKSFPERHDLDMAAVIIPAKEVGGDLYDYFIRDEKLFFCIGDVSGKGVPASLVMAVTRTMFRGAASHEDSPERIVQTMNDSMADMNENDMFVTFFLGVLDLTNGHLSYCNAGHNPPRALTDHIFDLPVRPNLPLGIMQGFPFEGQEMDLIYDDALFLYTDGLTEAENSSRKLFGEARMDAALHGRRSAMDHLRDIQTKVEDFVGDAPQSDDLTMLFIHYLGTGKGEHMTLTNDISQISLLAGFMDKVADENGLDPGLAIQLNLAIEEATTNVIMYAYPEGTEGKVELGASRQGDNLIFTLADWGKPFDPTMAPKADISASLEDRPIGGLGIHLVRTIMDGVSYKRAEGKNVLTMIKHI